MLTALFNWLVDKGARRGNSLTNGIIYHVSGGMQMVEWEANIILSKVDPDLPLPTIKKGKCCKKTNPAISILAFLYYNLNYHN